VTLAASTWTEVAGRAAETVLAVPLGSTEQHGPHLPLATDSLVAVALAEGLARSRPGVLVAPPVHYGSSGEHAGFPGTLSIGRSALEHLVVELVRSADAFAGVVLVSGHGGNAEPLSRAAALLGHEGRRVLAWSPRPAGGDAHAGRTETSLMLALAPSSVRIEAAVPGDGRPLAEVVGVLRTRGVAAVSPIGVLGNPLEASPEEGRALLDQMTGDLVSAVAAWCR
jgi:mycofactocin precursor peptide peptidase